MKKEWGIHVENLFKVSGGLMWAVLGKIAVKLPAGLAEDLNRDSDMIDAMVRAAVEHQSLIGRNPFEMTVDQQLTALRCAAVQEKWRITHEDLARLASTAPPWPKGKHAYRSFRIRFGEGDEGVAKTFEAHVARIKSVFTEKGFWRWGHLHSGVERLRLLNGNHTHKPVIEWVVADLDTNRKRDSITAVRGLKSLADELLVIAWMFPDMIRAIDHDKLPGLFAAGYEVNVPGLGDGSWQDVVLVYFNRGSRRVVVNAHDRGDDDSDYSVPALRE